MEFIDSVARDEYPNDIVLEEEKLLEITPDDIARHFKNMAYGTPTPGPNDKPVHCRSSNLEFAKKAISFFMPDRIAPWTTRDKTGNPTRSVQVNQVIKDVKKAEVRKEGVPSQARRDLKRNEFEKTLEILESQVTGRNFCCSAKFRP